MDRKLYATRTHIEELITSLEATKRWLEDNEPVKAWKAVNIIEQKIKDILKEMDEGYGNTISTSG